MSTVVTNTLQSLNSPQNEITVDEIVQFKMDVFLQLKRRALESGYNLVDGSFELGAVVTSSKDVVWCQTDGNYYSGPMGIIPSHSTPNSNWVDRSSEYFGILADRVGTLSANNKAAVFGQLQQFSKSRVCRVVHCGTSIANNQNSATKQFLGELKSALGNSGNTTQHLGALGGSYDTPHRGWKKQPFGGFALIRSRGDSASEPLEFRGVFDEMVLRYSTEMDGGNFDIYVDGIQVTTINSYGPQSYGNEYIYSPHDKKYHIVEVRAPVSGYAYLETLDMNMNNPGIHILDASLGGSSLRDMILVRTPSTNQISGVPINENVGIDSIFNNTNSKFKPDLIVSTYTVNDAGGGVANVNTYFKPGIQRLVDSTRTNGIPLLLIVEMGGHYSLPNHWAHVAFDEVRKTILSYRNEPHVTVIDWHDLSGMNTDDPTLLKSLGERMYSVTNINVDAVTFSGDFIHPNNVGYAILAQQLYSMSGITPYGYQGKSYDFYDEKAKRITSLPNLDTTSNYSTVQSVVGISKTITNEIGRKYEIRVIGNSLQADSKLSEPLYFAENEYNYGTKELNDYIVAAGTSDDYGSYRTLTNYNYYPNVPATLPEQSCTFTMTMIVGPGTTFIGVSNTSNTALLTRKINGVSGIVMTGKTQVVNTSDVPIVTHITVDSYYGNPFFTFKGKIYKVYITPTEFACIPSKIYETSRLLKPSLIMVGDMAKETTIQNQLYIENINSKVIEKICIGGEVIKPLDSTGHIKSLYRLQNRSDVKNSRMTLEGTLTINSVLDEKSGGFTLRTTQNPQRLKSIISFTSTDAGKIYTVCGTPPAGTGVAIYLYTGSTNTYIALNSDGSWTNVGNSHSAAPNLMSSYQNYGGMPTAFTFTLPDASVYGSYTWYIYAAFRGATSTNIIGDFAICEGSSAVT